MDLTMEDASQAFRLISRAARSLHEPPGATANRAATSGIARSTSALPGWFRWYVPPPRSKRHHTFRTFRVVLGDPRQLERTASQQRTLRARIKKLGEADVLIDSQAPSCNHRVTAM